MVTPPPRESGDDGDWWAAPARRAPRRAAGRSRTAAAHAARASSGCLRPTRTGPSGSASGRTSPAFSARCLAVPRVPWVPALLLLVPWAGNLLGHRVAVFVIVVDGQNLGSAAQFAVVAVHCQPSYSVVSLSVEPVPESPLVHCSPPLTCTRFSTHGAISGPAPNENMIHPIVTRITHQYQAITVPSSTPRRPSGPSPHRPASARHATGGTPGHPRCHAVARPTA